MNKSYFKYLIVLCSWIFLSSYVSTEILSVKPKKKIKSFSISGTKGKIKNSNKTILVVLPETDLTALTPKIEISKGATITPKSGTPQDFTNPVKYKVTAADGSSVDYTVTVESSAITFTTVENEIVVFTNRGKKYEIIKKGTNWYQAVAIAVGRGGYLVEIDDLAEQNAIFSALVSDTTNISLPSTRNEFSRGAVWLGGHDSLSEGLWIWDGNDDKEGDQFWNGDLSGGPVGNRYTNWGNEPDNFNGQNSLSMNLEYRPRTGIGEWDDLDGFKSSLYFVIEYD